MATHPFADVTLLRSAVEHLEFDDLDVLPVRSRERMLTDLRETVVQFLDLRFNEPVPTRYLEWCERRGSVILSDEQFAQRYSLAALEEESRLNLGRPLRDGEGVEEVFRELWRPPAAPTGMQRDLPVRYGAPPEGMRVAFGRLEHPRMPSSARLGGPLPQDAWYGGTSTTCGCWVAGTAAGYDTRDALLETFRSLIAADVGVVMHYRDAQPRPYVLYLLWDPQHDHWRIDGLTINNFRPSRGEGPCIVY